MKKNYTVMGQSSCNLSRFIIHTQQVVWHINPKAQSTVQNNYRDAIYLNKTIVKIEAIAKVVGVGNVSVERLRVELSKDVNLLYATVQAIAYWYVYEPVTATNWNLMFKKMLLENISRIQQQNLNFMGIFPRHEICHLYPVTLLICFQNNPKHFLNHLSIQKQLGIWICTCTVLDNKDDLLVQFCTSSEQTFALSIYINVPMHETCKKYFLPAIKPFLIE